jgi:DNA-binding transcriptional regulator YiaG
MGKVETVLKAEIARLSRRETRRLMTKHVEDLRRLRQRVAALDHEVRSLKKARTEEGIKARIMAASETAAARRDSRHRLSPGLIRALRRRLNITQAELAKLVGVSTVAVGMWESGATRPRPETKARIVALRGLGRREVRRLLAKPD